MGQKTRQWDIFCKVVDNFGDIGVCWRLARQLSHDEHQQVRLWVDDLHSLHQIEPAIDPGLQQQHLQQISICHWDAQSTFETIAEVVVEAFACGLPDAYLARLQQRHAPFCWINLEYLTAETWAEDCHAMISPHPRLGIPQYFYFPGFTDKTGGLFREQDLLARVRLFQSNPAMIDDFWQRIGVNPPAPGERIISLFAYENESVMALVDALSHQSAPTRLMVTNSKIRNSLQTGLETRGFPQSCLQTGQSLQIGALTITFLPFLHQDEYDQLLWACDLNFVRGEDSFLRAQWAGKPFVWHIYAQDENAHLVKLDAFLTRYTHQLPSDLQQVLRKCMHEWNEHQLAVETISTLLGRYAEYLTHAVFWQKTLEKQPPLARQLAQFSENRLK